MVGKAKVQVGREIGEIDDIQLIKSIALLMTTHCEARFDLSQS